MAKRTRTPTRAERVAAAQRELDKTLQRTRVVVLRKRGVKASRPAFPDYTLDQPNLAPLSQCKGGNGFRRTKTIAVPEGFHIGSPHKQGMQLVPNREAEWSGGKKS